MFQSLFSWIWLSKRDDLTTPVPYDDVSILVFVDLALEDILGDKAEKRYVSFNPCFRGSGSRSLHLSSVNRLFVKFQSLFSWIWLSKHFSMPMISLQS